MASFFDTVFNEVANVLGLRTQPQPVAGYMMQAQDVAPKPHDVRDMPLSGADLVRAKVKLARKFDRSWEDR